MRTSFMRLTTAVSVALCAGDLVANGQPHEPYLAVRELRRNQEFVAKGDQAAWKSLRDTTAKAGEVIASAPSEAFKDARNARALVVYALSGGDPQIVRAVLGRVKLDGINDSLIKGALAYGEGRTGEAAELLLGFNAREAPAGIGGQLALVQSMLVGKGARPRAIGFLDDARLLAPGTLVEESALRRQLLLAAAEKMYDSYEQLASQYFRRFYRSIYAEDTRRQLVAEVTRGGYATQPQRWRPLVKMIQTWPEPLPKDILVALAEEGIIAGRIELVRAAAAAAAQLLAVDSPDALRAKVYEGAALIVTDEYNRGLELLRSIDKSQLEPVDAELHAAAIDIAYQLRRMPEEPPAVVDAVPQLRSSERALKAISIADSMLRGDGR